jgi:hypothetical protein
MSSDAALLLVIGPGDARGDQPSLRDRGGTSAPIGVLPVGSAETEKIRRSPGRRCSIASGYAVVEGLNAVCYESREASATPLENPGFRPKNRCMRARL